MESLRESILGADDRARELVEDTPESWNAEGRLFLQEPGGEDYIRWSTMVANRGGKLDAEAARDLLLMMLVGDDGLPVFQPEDGPALMAKNGRYIDRLATRAVRKAGFIVEVMEETKGN